MKILFFTTSLEHTTFRKTALMLQREGAIVHMLGFTRSNFPSGNSNELSIESLGKLSHGNYLTRVFKLLKFLSILRQQAQDYDVIYNFTLDTLLISKFALLFKRKKWVYQIQDIRAIYFGNSWKNKVARFLEKTLLKRVDLLVVSSLDFYIGHFKKNYNFDEKRVHVVENKLIKGSVNPETELETSSNKISIGYFGVMRCIRSWEILREFAKLHPEKVEVYLRGKPLAVPTLPEQAKGLTNVEYGGFYKSPEDLNELYNRVDIVWACYPYSYQSSGNWQMARTIRFYEACAFGKPVIVQKGTPQAKDVLLHNLGLVIDMANPTECIVQLESIDSDKLAFWKENIQKLDDSFFYHNQEYRQLLEQLKNL